MVRLFQTPLPSSPNQSELTGWVYRFIFLGTHFNYASKALSLITKVVVNQIVFTPIFNSYFFGMQSLLSGDSFSEVLDRIRRTVPVSFVNSCKLWPAVTAFSFTFISPHYRSIFAGFIAIGWQTYLSFLNRQAEDAEKRDREALVASDVTAQNVCRRGGEDEMAGEKVQVQ
jgi:protein Mpv17